MSKRGMRNTDVPGDAVASHAAYVRQLVRQAEVLLDFERTVGNLDENDLYIRGLSLRFPQDDRPEYLAVVRVDGPEGRQVAFHSAPTLLETLVGVANRLKNNTLKFREDNYEQGNAG